MDSFARILDAWNEPDAEAREGLVTAVTTPDLFYDDVHKRSPTRGRDAFLAFLAFFRERVSGVTIALDGAPEVLDGAARLRFVLTRNGAVFSRGTYFVTLSDGGRIDAMYGFIDMEPGAGG